MGSCTVDKKSDAFILSPDTVFLDVDLKTPEEVLSFIGKKAQQLGVTKDGAALASELRERENSLSTGLMDGFAIPHAKTDLVNSPMAMFIRTKSRIAWKMLEGESAQQFFVMLVPTRDANKEHLEMLSKIAVCLLDASFREQVSKIVSPDSMATYLIQSLNGDGLDG